VDTVFSDAPDHHRYELRSGDELVGVLAYRLHGEVIRLVHTEVRPEFDGQGHAATLTRAALDDARSRGLAVRPDCPYVAAYIDKHPDYADLVAR
jgi:predicted GNAT family acetyltransferase